MEEETLERLRRKRKHEEERDKEWKKIQEKHVERMRTIGTEALKRFKSEVGEALPQDTMSLIMVLVTKEMESSWEKTLEEAIQKPMERTSEDKDKDDERNEFVNTYMWRAVDPNNKDKKRPVFKVTISEKGAPLCNKKKNLCHNKAQLNLVKASPIKEEKALYEAALESGLMCSKGCEGSCHQGELFSDHWLQTRGVESSKHSCIGCKIEVTTKQSTKELLQLFSGKSYSFRVEISMVYPKDGGEGVKLGSFVFHQNYTMQCDAYGDIRLEKNSDTTSGKFCLVKPPDSLMMTETLNWPVLIRDVLCVFVKDPIVVDMLFRSYARWVNSGRYSQQEEVRIYFGDKEE